LIAWPTSGAARVEAGTRVLAALRADYLGWLAESPELSVPCVIVGGKDQGRGLRLPRTR